jgi:hypothetical protein
MLIKIDYHFILWRYSFYSCVSWVRIPGKMEHTKRISSNTVFNISGNKFLKFKLCVLFIKHLLYLKGFIIYPFYDFFLIIKFHFCRIYS